MSLAEQRPDIAGEWHPSLNGTATPAEVNAGAVGRAHWLCSACGHVWESAIYTRTRARSVGCVECGRQRISTSRSSPLAGESLAEQYPDIAAQWHPTANGPLTPEGVKPRSGRKIRWLCGACGHPWIASLKDRIRADRTGGCPRCARYGYDDRQPGVLYFLHSRDLNSYKVGITGATTSRLAQFKRAGWQVLSTQLFEDGAMARRVERAIHTWWRADLSLPVWLGSEDMNGLGGHTETICASELSPVIISDRIRQEISAAERTAQLALAA